MNALFHVQERDEHPENQEHSEHETWSLDFLLSLMFLIMLLGLSAFPVGQLFLRLSGLPLHHGVSLFSLEHLFCGLLVYLGATLLAIAIVLPVFLFFLLIMACDPIHADRSSKPSFSLSCSLFEDPPMSQPKIRLMLLSSVLVLVGLMVTTPLGSLWLRHLVPSMWSDLPAWSWVGFLFGLIIWALMGGFLLLCATLSIFFHSLLHHDLWRRDLSV